MGGNSNFARPMPPTYRGCTVHLTMTMALNEHIAVLEIMST